MKSPNKYDELKVQIETYFKSKGAATCSVKFLDDKYANSTCVVSLKRGYELGNVMSFANMKWLSDLFHTDKIDIDNEYHQDGCETCDHGSYDSADLVCYEIDPFTEASKS